MNKMQSMLTRVKNETAEEPDRTVPSIESRRASPANDDALRGAATEEIRPAGSKEQPRRWRRWLRSALLILGPLLVLLAGGYFYFTGGRFVETDNAYVKADKVMVSAEVSGLIAAVPVHENQHVKKGDVLFRIDDQTYRLDVAAANAHLENIRAELEGLKASYRQKVEELALARANADFANKEFERQSKLMESHVTSISKFDSTQHDLRIAQWRVRVVEQEIGQIRAQLGGNPDIKIEDHPRYLEAAAAKRRAVINFERTVVKAPFAGIAGNTPQVGQQVIGNAAFVTPVMSIISDQGFWIEANFKETDLTHVKPGQPVSIHVDTYPDRVWHGTVNSISQATGAEFSVIPPQNATGNWIKVVQRLPVRIAVKSRAGDPPLRVGMSTTVEIDTGHRRAMPGVLRTVFDWLGTPRAAGIAHAG